MDTHFNRTALTSKLIGMLAFSAVATASLGLAACQSELDGKPTASVRDAPARTEPISSKPAAARTLSLDSAASTVAFVGAKVTGDHRGTFLLPAGTVELDADGALLALDVTIATDRLSIEPEKLAGHLRSGDFFDVAQYPEASFKLSKFEPSAAGNSTHTVTGTLDLHGVRKQIQFPATVDVGSQGVKASASFKIDRHDFGIVYAGMADDLIKDDVLLELDLRFSARAT